MSAGYSGTPLTKKLGIKPSALVALVHSPAGFAKRLHDLPEGVTMRKSLRGNGCFDVIVWFPCNASDLRQRFTPIADRLTSTGGLWVGWPKKTSGVQSDLRDAVVRKVGLHAGLVDNKVCAINEIYSGLRFVVRIADRG